MVQIDVGRKSDVADWLHSLYSTKPSMVLEHLFSGDRWSCVDELVVATVDGEIIGIATIAPQGAMASITMVAIYVLPDYRQMGIGFNLLEAVVDYLLLKGINPIRFEVMNSRVLRMIDRLPAEKWQKISVVDLSVSGICDAMFEN